MRFTLAAVAATLASTAAACSTPSNFIVTFYGYPDNDPPGPATAYNCGGRNYKAGGIGTYADPVTFAAAPGAFNNCEIVYLPFLTKYARFEDSCAVSSNQFFWGAFLSIIPSFGRMLWNYIQPSLIQDISLDHPSISIADGLHDILLPIQQ